MVVTFAGNLPLLTAQQVIQLLAAHGGVVIGNVLQAAITSQWVAQDNFAGRSNTDIGVGEIIDLTEIMNPVGIPFANIGGLQWAINAGGGAMAAVNVNAGTAQYTANGGPGNVQLRLQNLAGNVVDQKNITVIAPNGVNLIHDGSNIWHVNGRASVGFRAISYLRPTNVSFSNIRTQEGTVAGIANGFFAGDNGDMHPMPGWNNVGPGNIANGCKELYNYDTIESGPHNGPYAVGNFTWNIPIEYDDGTNGVQAIPGGTLSHVERIEANGDMTIHKGAGGPFTKRLNDPNSNY
ncbi:MAG: hypothetical protein D3924_16315 [Candidatus Electrothrix sp. AR4]|nr:hypothetical protein [Candidatus Electrothrix sp. AR4]